MKKTADKFRGLWPVMLTPFRENKTIDFRALDLLTEFYLDSGAMGLFANCLSSEMFELTGQERLAVIRAVVRRVRGKIPIVATGTFGGPVKDQAEFINKIYNLGVDAGILITSLLAREKEDESRLEINISRLARLLPGIPLGLYECPVPYKRILSAKLTARLASTGRFLYLKDTTCNTGEIKAKIKAASGTELSIFNANTPTALDSLRAGADGLSAISANFYPEFYTWLYRNSRNSRLADKVNFLSDELTMMDAITRINYPMNAKVFLARRGIRIKPVSRISGRGLNEEEGKMLDKLFIRYKLLAKEFA
jgi:4-hydroxy-tetrahydrodipicolinate synthase